MERKEKIFKTLNHFFIDKDFPIEKRTSRVFKHEITRITIYETFCEEDMPFISNFPLKESIIKVTGTPFRYTDTYTREKEEILECIYNLKTSFDDPQDRQINFIKLKNKLGELRSKLTLAQRNFLRSVNMCIDALENTKAELINKEQIEAMEHAFKIINETMDEFQVNLLQKILIKSGLKPIPNLEGISELY